MYMYILAREALNVKPGEGVSNPFYLKTGSKREGVVCPRGGGNGRMLNQYEAKGILVNALGLLAVHYGYSR
jgi:hypothetical protein